MNEPHALASGPNWSIIVPDSKEYVRRLQIDVPSHIRIGRSRKTAALQVDFTADEWWQLIREAYACEVMRSAIPGPWRKAAEEAFQDLSEVLVACSNEGSVLHEHCSSRADAAIATARTELFRFLLPLYEGGLTAAEILVRAHELGVSVTAPSDSSLVDSGDKASTKI